VARVFSAGFWFLLAWTVGAHAAALCALGFGALYADFALALLAATLGAIFPIVRVFDGASMGLPAFNPSLRELLAGRKVSLVAVAALAVAFAATAAIQYKLNLFTPFWFACLAAAALALWTSRRGAGASAGPATAPAHEAREQPVTGAFAVLALSLAAFYFLTSIPDADDSLYLNFSTGAKLERGALLAHDTMLGITGLALIKSTYLLESYHLLTALISDASGLPAILVSHSVVPALMCIWAASVLTLVHHALFRGQFRQTLVLHLLVLVSLDGSFASYAYHAVPRFFQGKGPFVMALVPLLALLALAAARDYGWRLIGLLAGAVIISVGLTANAIYAAPLVVVLAVLPRLLAGDGMKPGALRLLAVPAYPLALAVYLLLFNPPGASEFASAGTPGDALWSLMGLSAPALALALALLFAACAAAFFQPRLRSVSLYAAGVLVLALNPFTWSLYGRLVTGNLNYRLMWAVPLPLVLAGLLGLAWSTRNLIARSLVAASLLAGICGPWSILHKVEFGPAFTKVPRDEFQVARMVVQSALPADLALAPEEIAAWIPTQEGAPAVVEGRALYIPQRRGAGHSEALADRAAAFLLWDGRQEAQAGIERPFMDELDRLGVTIIVLDARRPVHARMLPLLRSMSFVESGTHGAYVILRRGAAGRGAA
jgi:hypothetical protein